MRAYCEVPPNLQSGARPWSVGSGPHLRSHHVPHGCRARSRNHWLTLPSPGHDPPPNRRNRRPAPLRELDDLIDGDRYFLPPRIKTLRAIRAKIRPEPVREPLPPPPYAAGALTSFNSAAGVDKMEAVVD